MPKVGRSILTTLLFTDIVGSTSVAQEMRDRRWRELLARHHRLIRSLLKRHQGRELDTAGDWFFARFDTPASAIRCACAASDAVRALGVEIRAGVHIGECEELESPS
jgi:class 3 adenylate cyclase